MSSYNQWGLRPGTLKMNSLISRRAWGAIENSASTLRDSTTNNMTEIHHRSISLKNTWGIQEEDLLLISEHMQEGMDLQRNKGAGQ